MILNERQAHFLIVALDLPDFDSATHLVKALGEKVAFYKIGMQLFFAAGDKILPWLKDQNKKVFLDLKLNDIPTTIEKATKVLRRYAPDLLTVFGDGTVVRAARNGSHPNCKILNVTVLTSHSSRADVTEVVLQRAYLTKEFGGDGVVCSGLETSLLRRELGLSFLIVNPGIRPAGSAADDQNRVVTPSAAWQAGASHIVVGRPITSAVDPVKVTEDILQELV